MNSLVRSQQNMPVTQDGWMWNGSSWVCDPDDCPPSPCPPCPPFPPFPGFIPPPANQPPWFPGANGGVFFSPPTQPPPNPVRGAFWWDGTTLHLFDGAVWVAVGGTTAGGGPTTGAGSGQVIISTSAPGNPVVGEEWWNGSILQVWDGSSWKTVGPGMGGPVPTTTVSFALAQPGFFTAPTAWGLVVFTATPQVDISQGFDPATKKFTPKKAGVYLFQAMLWESGGGAIAITKNDPGFFNDTSSEPVVGIAGSATTGYLQISGTSVMNGTTDFVRLYGWSSSGQFWGDSAPPALGAVLLP